LNAWHPSDDDLVLHFYGESGADADRLDAHLAVCGRCRIAWTDLRDTLSLVDHATTPDPGHGFERVMWARVQQALPARPRTGDWLRRLIPAGALAAVVIAAVTVTYQWRDAGPDPATVLTTSSAPNAAAPNPATVERVLLTALNAHFEQTEVLLVELMNADFPEVEQGIDLSFERVAADDLVLSGRLYRLTAQQTGQTHLVRMLEDLETVLIEVARGPERASPREVQSIRTRIDDASLLFKVRAVSDVIQVRQRELMTSDD
jgi:hypothetical protein